MRGRHKSDIWRRIACFLLLSAALLPIWGCSQPKEEKADLIVLHTGRIRGNVYPLSLQSIAPLQHYQYLAGYVRSVREEAKASGSEVFLVDMGDSLTGSFASHVTGADNMVTFFNDTGYDAVMLSNLDYAVPPATLAKLKAKVLNPFQDAAGKPATDGTVFGAKIDAGKIPVFLLANFYGDTSREEHPDRFPASFGASQSDVAPVRDYEAVLKALGERPPGSATLLSWMKFESPTSPPEAFLQKLRQLDITAILAHRIYGGKEKEAWTSSGFFDWKPPVALNILRHNGGFALSRLDLKREGNGWRVLRHQLLPMTANTSPADAKITEAIARFAKPISDADTKLGELPETVNQDAILKIYMAALGEVPGTQAVLYSPQSIRANWTAGTLRASQVYNSLPWTTPVTQLMLNPEQIAAAEEDLGLMLASANPPAGDTLVTTSEYFARLLAAKFTLPPEAIRETAQKSEFDYFVGYLKSHPEALSGGGAP